MRPHLPEALSVLKNLALTSEEAQELLKDYQEIKKSGDIFLASKLIVDFVQEFYKNLNFKQKVL